MKKSLIVIDDFYEDPYKVRQYAFSQNFNNPSYVTGYPGVETNSLEPEKIKHIAKRISSIIGKKLGWPPDRPQGVFRVLQKQEEKTQTNLVHIDPCSWTGVVYLNLPEECRGGTSFYQHKETGLKVMFPQKNPEVQQAMVKYNLSYHELSAKTLKDTLDLSKWDEIERVSMKFNRLILFNGGKFHGVPRVFGNTLATGRIAQIFFFFEIESIDEDGNMTIPV
ncbi:MAG: DUF6445 family protein [Candidatus Caenarcaniphilales bacterium]|nr:DUF6445 family protein [Candidatus Caenarcaniphilales bacterium]